MFDNILPSAICVALSKCRIKDLTELRIRVGKPVIAFMGRQFYYLCEDGLTSSEFKAIRCSKEQIEDIIFRASNCSIYACNEQIKRGYITLNNGARIGIFGDLIYESETIKTISNFSSINIRIPHQIRNCSSAIFKHIYSNNNIKNTLIISPPGAGKTTFLRDLVWQLSENDLQINVSVIDEKGEIASSNMELGNYVDVLSFCPKNIGFEYAIRNMAPQLIAVDEIASFKDVEGLISAFNNGVKIFATIHAASIDELKNKVNLKYILEKEYFDRFILLSCNPTPGTIEGVFNSKYNRIGWVNG